MNALSFLLALLVASAARAFAPSRTFRPVNPSIRQPASSSFESYAPAALQRQRHSVAPIQTMGLFGLGAPEIAVILVAAAFLLGPQKLAELGKDAGKIAGELKEVPKEFQAGLKEGEQRAMEIKSSEEKVEVVDAVKVEEQAKQVVKEEKAKD